jgi:predicted  nucleic acid-binding Zn-ribbon protein
VSNLPKTIRELKERIAELEGEAVIAMKQHHDLCWKIEELQKDQKRCAKNSLRINNKHLAKVAELEGVLFDLLSLGSFAVGFPFEYDKLEALKDGK